MSKPLLTALLIAGLSATAKAESEIYLCNTIEHAFVDIEGVKNIPSAPFKMFADKDKNQIRLEGMPFTRNLLVTDGVGEEHLVFWPSGLDYGEIAFYGGNHNSAVEYRHNTLAVTQVGFKVKGGIGSGPQTFMLNAFLAECNKL